VQVRASLAGQRGQTGTVTIRQYRFQKIKQNTPPTPGSKLKKEFSDLKVDNASKHRLHSVGQTSKTSTSTNLLAEDVQTGRLASPDVLSAASEAGSLAGIVRSKVANRVVPTRDRLHSSQIPKALGARLIVTSPCHRLPALLFEFWQPCATWAGIEFDTGK